MSGLFGVIETGKQALFASQSSLQILNHNVANAGTEGYSRQRVLLGARTSLGEMGWPSGDGVEVLGVQRVSDQFMTSRLGRARGDLGYQNSRAEGFDLLELAFGEPADANLGESSLGDTLSAFLDSWQTALSPDNGDGTGNINSIILESAEQLALRFNSLSAELEAQAADLRRQLEADVEELNRLLAEVASYNEELAGSPLSESARCNTIDAREQALLALSDLVGAEWTENEEGLVSVKAGSHSLVEGISAQRLEATLIEGEGRLESLSLRVEGSEAGIELPSGEIRGRLELLQDDIPQILADLDSLAAGIIEQMNAIHQSASGAAGGGVDLFSGSDAASMQVSDVLSENPDLLSTAGTLPDGTDIAQAVFDLHYEGLDALEGRSLEDYYAGMIGELGAKSSTAQTLGSSALNLAEGIQDRAESVSGVSLDEEMAEMMMVQAAFQASSRVITVADEMLDAILATV